MISAQPIIASPQTVDGAKEKGRASAVQAVKVNTGGHRRAKIGFTLHTEQYLVSRPTITHNHVRLDISKLLKIQGAQQDTAASERVLLIGSLL